jgi:two-component system chemotaxis response regulator CheB
MDIVLPGMDGVETTRRIMESSPVPVVVISAHLEEHEVYTACRIIGAGAVAVVEKPSSVLSPDHAQNAREIVRTVKAMAEVRLIRRQTQPAGQNFPLARTPTAVSDADPIEIVAMGGSTGAPLVFRQIIGGLPKDLSVPVVLVQHMAPGFTEGMAKWLRESTGRQVHVASNGEAVQPALVYVAPENRHMGLRGDRTIELNDGPAEHRLKPAVSYLFRSVARVYGARCVGVLLTGMGVDGAAELKQMRLCGAVTIAQDGASSVVFGMPGEAIRIGGAALVLSPEEISEAITRLVDNREWPNHATRLGQ